MPSVYDALYEWAKKTTTSFAELRLLTSERDEQDQIGDGLIYRPSHYRTADVYRALSVMSNRPVNRHWILAHSKLHPAQVDLLLQRLVDNDAVEVVDASKFRAAASV